MIVRNRSCPAVSHCRRETRAEGGSAATAKHRGQLTHDLQLDRLALQLHRPDFEVNANCADVRLRVGVVGCGASGGGRAELLVATFTKSATQGRHRQRGPAARMERPRHATLSSTPHSPKRSKRHDFPTPLSPIRSNLNRKSLHQGRRGAAFNSTSIHQDYRQPRRPRTERCAAGTRTERHSLRCSAGSLSRRVTLRKKSHGEEEGELTIPTWLTLTEDANVR